MTVVRGPPGPPGVDGKDGKDGKDGAKGDRGMDICAVFFYHYFHFSAVVVSIISPYILLKYKQIFYKAWNEKELFTNIHNPV